MFKHHSICYVYILYQNNMVDIGNINTIKVSLENNNNFSLGVALIAM